jgi:hypothetical protein
MELDRGKVATARGLVPRARIERADFFDVEWERVMGSMRGPLLVVGNPPWVTSATLGALGSANAPAKTNFKRLRGIDARTGAANFDVSEWMILRLLEAMRGRRATLAMLCKTAVARRVIEAIAGGRASGRPGGLWRIDASRHFDASVDAALFVVEAGGREERSSLGWPVFASLEARVFETSIGVAGGALVADSASHDETRHLTLVGRTCDPEWRSGLKHDLARVMELVRREEGDGGAWVNGLGEVVDVEDEIVFPLLKSSDVANGRTTPQRAVIVPQRALGDDTSRLPPRARAYLARHRGLFDARKSSIYRGRAPFAVFGVGAYSFAPWKVAVSGLYKRLAFVVVGPLRGRSVMLDDTCYFLPFDDERDARSAAAALASPLAERWFRGRVFWEDKRPIRKSLLQSLDLDALRRARDRDRRADRPATRAPR